MPHTSNNLLLSHHRPAEAHRCLRMPWRGTAYLVCARCAGGFVGAVLGGCLLATGVGLPPPWIALAAFPDWLAAAFGQWRGNNLVRVTSGGLLGLLYADNISCLFQMSFPVSLWLVNAVLVGVWVGVLVLRVRATSPSKAEREILTPDLPPSRQQP